jgi:hypothetical protein
MAIQLRLQLSPYCNTQKIWQLHGMRMCRKWTENAQQFPLLAGEGNPGSEFFTKHWNKTNKTGTETR